MVRGNFGSSHWLEIFCSKQYSLCTYCVERLTVIFVLYVSRLRYLLCAYRWPVTWQGFVRPPTSGKGSSDRVKILLCQAEILSGRALGPDSLYEAQNTTNFDPCHSSSKLSSQCDSSDNSNHRFSWRHGSSQCCYSVTCMLQEIC